MAKYFFYGALVLLFVGCVARITPMSPRLVPTEAHRTARTNVACLDCHADKMPTPHKSTDNCVKCHKLPPGGAS